MRWLVTGGAGFIGANLVVALCRRGDEVVVVDDLSRKGSEENERLLREQFGLTVERIDVASADAVRSFLQQAGAFDAVGHMAGQVSLLASIADPRRDFEVNALGTLNILEGVREFCPEAVVIGMSSNKVYGDLSGVRIIEENRRFVAPDFPKGFSESLPLDFHGPYGCSKGAADQYLRDYHRTFGLRTFSLRQSSVYGPLQHPRFDQGWVAFLLGEAIQGRTIGLNGVGKQVRDLLHVEDLARLIITLGESDSGFGHAFNVGGGPDRALSILDLFDWFEQHTGKSVFYQVGNRRPSDQEVFVSDNTLVSSHTGWTPQVSLDEGLSALV